MTKNILDTSALLKAALYPQILEAGSMELSKFMEGREDVFTLDLCIGEALGLMAQAEFYDTFKRRNIHLSPDVYIRCAERLLSFTRPDGGVQVISTLDSAEITGDMSRMIKRYKIGIVDALVVHEAFENGPSMLITSYEALYKAARSIKLDAWICTRDTAPKC